MSSEILDLLDLLSEEDKLKVLAAASQKITQHQRNLAFDPTKLESRPNPKQQLIINDYLFDEKLKNLFVLGGNQCLSKGTMVDTPNGPTPIENIKVGDIVCSEYGNYIPVKKVFNNGIKRVAALTDEDTGEILAYCTEKHRFGKRVNGVWQCRTASTLFQGGFIHDFSGRKRKVSWGDNAHYTYTYDIHVGSKTNLYRLSSGVITHNSGKTTTMLRLLCWLFEENYPGWSRPKQWEGEGLTFLLLSRTGKQINESIVPRLQSMLSPGTYKIINQGNIAQAIHSTKTNNRIILQSYENENVARERVQSYTIHGVFIDEMPRTYALLEECQRRIQAKRGKLITAFTPKILSQEIKKAVDASDGIISKKYQLLMLDNPIYTDEDRTRIMSELATASEAYRNTVLTGAWLGGENSVYQVTQGMIRAPENYSRSWRHLEGSDPAVHSIHGMVILAEDPSTGYWYVVQEHEISGLADPTQYPLKVQELTQYLNIVRRVYDVACPWYAQLATKIGMSYMGNWNKNSTDRRLEMIKNTQVLLGSRVFIAPWCTNLIEELETMQWSESREGKVANSDKYHLADAFRYALDLLPSYEGVVMQNTDWQAQLRVANEERKKQEAAKTTLFNGRVQRTIKTWSRRRR